MIEYKAQGLIKLQNNPVKQYAWGCSNNNCYVGELSGKSTCKNYAQLWMGIHCHGQSQIKITKGEEEGQKFIKLSQYFSKNNCKPIEFLYKVLSIEKCLSIQVHPNKEQAIELNKNRPDIYADDNDKPEMFYTLSQFECFFGYVNMNQFQRIRSLSYFNQCIQKIPENPKQMILSILKLDSQSQQNLIKESLSHLQQIHPIRYDLTKSKDRRIWKIAQDFPNDIGIVVSFFLDYKIVPPGLCYYIESNTPHAYIYGECLEIMKNSDNVCRLGLTPKYKDLQIISSVLGDHFLQRHPIQPKIKQYKGLIGQLFEHNGLKFQILRTQEIQQNQSLNIYPEYSDSNAQSRICLIIEGQFMIEQINGNCLDEKDFLCEKGEVILMKPNIQYQINGAKQNGILCIGWSEF